MDDIGRLVIIDFIPEIVFNSFKNAKGYSTNSKQFIDLVKEIVSENYIIKHNTSSNSSEMLKENLNYINNNQNMLYQIYKYNVKIDYFQAKDKDLIEKLNNFVESGILITKEVSSD